MTSSTEQNYTLYAVVSVSAGGSEGPADRVASYLLLAVALSESCGRVPAGTPRVEL